MTARLYTKFKSGSDSRPPSVRGEQLENGRGSGPVLSLVEKEGTC